MIIGASADWSTRDTERGYVDAFEALGHHVILYSLNNRFKAIAEWLSVLRDGYRCRECGVMALEPREAFAHVHDITAVEQASEASAYIALMQNADLVVVISGGLFHANAVVAMRRAGIPVVTVLTESPYQDEGQRILTGVATLATTNERRSVDILHETPNMLIADPRVGGPHLAHVMYGPPAYNPNVNKPTDPEPDKVCDVVLVGTGFQERVDLLCGVNWEGINLRLIGYWKDPPEAIARYVWSGPIDNAEAMAWYASAKIVLNTHRSISDGMVAESIGPRVYETAALGAFQLCDDSRAELNEIFGASVPTFKAHNPESLEISIRSALSMTDAERHVYTQVAQQVTFHHTYRNRVSAMLTKLEQLGAIKVDPIPEEVSA